MIKYWYAFLTEFFKNFVVSWSRYSVIIVASSGVQCAVWTKQK